MHTISNPINAHSTLSTEAMSSCFLLFLTTQKAWITPHRPPNPNLKNVVDLRK